jgi:hypothetical protein
MVCLQKLKTGDAIARLTLEEEASRADLRRGGDIVFGNVFDRDSTKLCKL